MTPPVGFGLFEQVGTCPPDCWPLQVVEEPSSKFTSNFRAPPQAGGANLLYGGGATCYRHGLAYVPGAPKAVTGSLGG